MPSADPHTGPAPAASLASTYGGGAIEPGPRRQTSPPTRFGLFPMLPAELRLKIWQISFAPREVELHRFRHHYAYYADSDVWLSSSRNPVALSVNTEARAAALEHYTVALPLSSDGGANGRPGREVGNIRPDPHRRLYVCPSQDTVLVLGEFNIINISSLLRFARTNDSIIHQKGILAATGFLRLGISAACFAHEGGGRSMRVYGRSLFRDLDQFILFLYCEPRPPPGWTTGDCELIDYQSSDSFGWFMKKSGAELRDGEGWLKIGKRQLKVMDLRFRA